LEGRDAASAATIEDDHSRTAAAKLLSQREGEIVLPTSTPDIHLESSVELERHLGLELHIFWTGRETS
jgi:hypothetical protein